MRRVLPFLLGAVGAVAFAAAGWAIAAAVDGDDGPRAVASPSAEEEAPTLQLPVTELVDGDPDDAALDEAAAVVLEEPPGDVVPTELMEGSTGEVADDAPDGSDTPVPTRRDAVDAVAAGSGDRVATVVAPRLTDLPADGEDRAAWVDAEGSDADPLPVGSSSAGDDGDLPGWLEDPGVVETEEDGAELPPGDQDDRILDLCAGPEPLEGCPEGVGGTVSLAIVGPFDIVGVVGAADDRCGIEPYRDRYVATIRSSAPGRFHLRTAPAPVFDDSQWSEVVEVATSAEEVARWEEDEGIVVQTCVSFPLDWDDHTFRVEILGNPLAGDGPGDAWTGEITPLHPTRPSVQFRTISGRAGSNDTVAVVSSRADEQVEIVRILREPGETTSACNRMEELRAAGYIPMWTETEWVHPFPAPPGTPEFPTVRLFELRRIATEGVDLCITWFRDLRPEREVVERRAFVVRPPSLPSVTFRLSELTTARGAQAPLDSVGFWLSDRSGREICRGFATDGGAEVCRLDTTWDAYTVVVHTQGYHRGSSGARESRALELQQALCAGESCGGWTRLALAGPDGAPGGSVRLDVRYANPPVASSSATRNTWTYGDLGTFGGDSERSTGRADLPRLDLTGTTIHYDPAVDPFAITVRWTADRPVTALLKATDPSGQSCRSDRSPGEVPLVRAEPTGAATSGEATFEACPGVTHHFAIRLSAPGGGTATFASGDLDFSEYMGLADETVDYWPGGHHTTPHLPVDLTYGARLRMGDWTGWVYVPPSDSWQPQLAHVDWWSTVADVQFSQSRRSGFIVHNSPTCTALTGFDVGPETVTPTPVRVSAGSGVLIRVDAAYTFYSACRLIQTPASDPIGTGGLVLSEWVPIYDLLHGAPVTVMKRGTPSNRPATTTCSRCVPYLYADVSATIAPRG